MPEETPDSIALGRAEVTRRRWRDGYDLLRGAAAEGPLDGTALDALADAAFALGQSDEYSEAREQAYAAHLGDGALQLAAADAVRLAVVFVRRGELARAAGWLGTGGSLLDDEPGQFGTGTALVTWLRGAFAAATGDLVAAEQLAEQTIDLGRRMRDLEVQTLGLVVRGEVLARRGRADDAGPVLDRAMATALGSVLSPWASCVVLCRTMISCQASGDLVRAQQWVDAAREARQRGGPVPLSGDCRVHHAGLLNWRGEWAEAEEEATVGCVELPHDLMHQGMAAYEVGEIRLRRGDLAGAEELLAHAHELGSTPQPALALAHWARGRGRAALALLEAALEDERAPVLRAPLLEAQVAIALTEERADVARAAGAELRSMESELSAPLVRALAASSRGVLALADGDLPAACSALREGIRRWTGMQAPYRAARTRVLLAQAYVARGDPDSASLELSAARTAFDRLGAQPDAQRAARTLRELSGDADLLTGHRVRRTFMFTDIVRSTPLLEALGDDAWSDLVRWHDATLRAQFAAHSGQEVDHAGDGFFVAFEDPAAAVRCALAIQRGLGAHRRTAGFAPQVRIGLHADDAIRADEGYRGRAVHVAARVGAEAGAGEILASAGTLEAPGVDMETGEPRVVHLKGLVEPMRLVPVRWA